ncbi:MAG: VCBS repeat-containing protein [Treponema sp.]|nr:VCBS repeat-containing protein [Treponema sp.]
MLALMVTACQNPVSDTPATGELTGTVTIEGTAAVGQTLTANTIALGGDGAISYQWFLAGQPISGETRENYLVKATDEGKTINVRVTRAGYNGSVTSVAVGPVTAQTSPLTGTVTIDGTPKTGQFLTANTTALGGSGTILYQWLRGSTDIPGATGVSYELTAADEGSAISVRVTRAGNSGSVIGGPTAAVVDGRPALSGTVVINGTAVIGQTLTANTGNLGGTGEISYQWLRGSTEISGAAGAIYKVAEADVGSTIKVRVTRAGNSGSVTSAATGTVSKEVSTSTTNAQYLAMLQSLGVNTTTPDLPVAPNGQPYDPQTSSPGPSASRARAVSSSSGPERSLGPLGKIYSQPKREIFVAGYVINGKNHALFEDFENSTLDRIGQDIKEDTGWAGGTESTRNLRKSVAADLDGIDEVVIAVIKDDKMLVYKGVYNGGNFTIASPIEFSLPETAGQMLPTDSSNLPFIGWTLISADLNGDGKQECILTLPGYPGAYMYVLDNNLAITQIHLGPYYPSGIPSGHRWFPMVTAADYDQDGKDELCLTIGVNEPNFNARYYILDYNVAGFTTLSENVITSGSFGLKMARVMAGDFTGDGLPDTVFYGTRNSDNNQRVVMLLQTHLNSAFEPVFTWVDSASRTFPDTQLIPQSAVGDVNGDRKADFIADNRLYTLNSSNQFEQISGTTSCFVYNYNGGMYEVVIGDVTGDRKDDVVFFCGSGNIEIYYYANGAYTSVQKNIGSNSYSETGCLPNVDKDSFILRDTGNRELLFSDPHVIAVLASAPYYAGINEDGNGGTYFGYTKGSSSGSSNSFDFSVGSSIGFDLEDPFGISGVEVEASMKNSFSWAQSESRDIQESWGWNNVLAQDLVIFTAIPFDVYYYEVLVPPDGGNREKRRRRHRQRAP